MVFQSDGGLVFVKTWEELFFGFWLLHDPWTKIKLISVDDVLVIESFIQGIVGGKRMVFVGRFNILFYFELLFLLFGVNL